MVIKFESNDYVGYISLDKISRLMLLKRGNGYIISTGNDVLAYYSSRELCEKAVEVIYKKYIENPQQIVNVPTEDELKENATDDDGSVD